MRVILAINAVLVFIAAIAPNDVLLWNSYLLYGIQLLSFVPYVMRRTRYISTLFLPSTFALVYFTINLAFGAYLVPRGFGWNKEYADVALNAVNYRVIVTYLLLANVVLFLLSIRGIHDVESRDTGPRIVTSESLSDGAWSLIWSGLSLALFAAVSILDIYSVFSFQLAIIIIHGTAMSRRRRWYRFFFYAAYLGVLVIFQYENKREVIMGLFAMIFLETFFARAPFEFSFGKMLAYSTGAVAFLGLILVSSILRGYGNFDVVSMFDALVLVPQYMSSDIFIDSLTDNLELNYSYGSTMNSIEMLLNGSYPHQYGASLLKVFFLPLPREMFPFKPDSIMQLYTASYAPEAARLGASFPVSVPSEMFVNFHFFGLLFLAFMWRLLDAIFICYHRIRTDCLKAYLFAFLFLTMLMLARGSGLEQWLLYCFVAAPLMLFVVLVRDRLKTGSDVSLRWVV